MPSPGTPEFVHALAFCVLLAGLVVVSGCLLWGQWRRGDLDASRQGPTPLRRRDD